MKIFENLIGIIDFSTDILMNSLASGARLGASFKCTFPNFSKL